MTVPFDAHPNGAYSTVATAPSPATSGTTLTVASGDGSKFLTGANAVLRVKGNILPIEIVRINTISGDNVTSMTRAQEGTTALSVDTTYEIYQGPTAKSLADIEQFFELATAARVYDEFLPFSSAGFGQLNWSTVGTASIIAGTAGHPGICRIATGSAFGAARAFNFGASILASDTFLLRTCCLVSDASPNGQYAVGLLGANGFQPPDAIYFRKAYADTNWQCVCRASNTETVVDSGVAAGTAFGTFQIRRIDGSTIGFTAPGGAEKTIATNVPTASLFPYFYLVNSSGTPTNIWFDVDAWLMLWTGLSR